VQSNNIVNKYKKTSIKQDKLDTKKDYINPNSENLRNLYKKKKSRNTMESLDDDYDNQKKKYKEDVHR